MSLKASEWLDWALSRECHGCAGCHSCLYNKKSSLTLSAVYHTTRTPQIGTEADVAARKRKALERQSSALEGGSGEDDAGAGGGAGGGAGAGSRSRRRHDDSDSDSSSGSESRRKHRKKHKKDKKKHKKKEKKHRKKKHHKKHRKHDKRYGLLVHSALACAHHSPAPLPFPS